MELSRRSVCPLDCPDTCGLLITTENNKMVRCGGDPQHPFTRGFICAKMRHYPELVNSPARVLTPLRRNGPKGSASFQPVTWQAALDEISSRWQAIRSTWGSEAILPYSYAGVMGLIQRNAGHAFFHRLGASRLQRTICSAAADAGWSATMGATWGTDPETVVDSDLVLLWGIDAAVTNLHFMALVKQAQRLGARVLVVDAYHSSTARQADEVLLVRPGSDAALALGVMHILERENLVDKQFIAQHVLGYDELKEQVLPSYHPPAVADLTGVPEVQIEKLAYTLAQAKAPFLRIGMGLSRHYQGAMTIRTLACLPALLGAYNQPGGGALLNSGTGAAFNLDIITRPDLQPGPTREINMNKLGLALTGSLVPPIKSLYVYHSNPAAVTPNQNKVIAGLSREDLFTVVHDRFLTATAAFADLVLPATFAVEQEDLYRSYGQYYLQLANSILSPPGEARSNWQVFCLLAHSMGFSDPIFSWSETDAIQQLLSQPSPFREGITYEQLAGGEPVRLKPSRIASTGWQTASGKIEILSTQAAVQGHALLPGYQPPGQDELAALYPWRLLTVPARFTLNSTFTQLPQLVQREGGAHLLINPDDCRQLGLEDGQLIEVYNQHGSCLLRMVTSNAAPPGVVAAPGVWNPLNLPGCRNINCLVGDDLTDLGGGSTFYAHRVNLRPAPR